MSIRNFIGASSAVLLAWLGATYFHKVPTERYPTQGKLSSIPTPGKIKASDGAVASADLPDLDNR